MGRAPDGKIDPKFVLTLVSTLLVGLGGGGSATYALSKGSTEAPRADSELRDRTTRLEAWRDSAEREHSRHEQALSKVATALDESAAATRLLQQTVVTMLADHAARITALERAKEKR